MPIIGPTPIPMTIASPESLSPKPGRKPGTKNPLKRKATSSDLPILPELLKPKRGRKSK